MSGRGTASLAQALPYWDLVDVATGDSSRPRHTFLLLKDGTVAVALGSPGLDLTGAAPARMENLSEQWAGVLAALPAHAFLQAIFATGGHYGATLTDFAQRSHPDSHPLLRRGREEQARMLGTKPEVIRAELTYWVGLRGALAGMLRARPSPSQRRHNEEEVREVCQALYASVVAMQGSLRSQGLQLHLLDRAQVLRELEAAVGLRGSPDRASGPCAVQEDADAAFAEAPSPVRVPTPEWDAPRLSERLAQRSIRCAVDHLFFAPPVPDELPGAPAQVRVLGMHELPSNTDAAMLHAMLFDAAGTVPLRVVFTHEKLDPLLQRTALTQRRKLLFAMMGRYFMDHEAKQAYEQTEDVLAQMAQHNAQVLRSSISVCVGPATAQAQVTACRRIVQAAARRGLGLHPCEDLQLDGWFGSLPAYGYSFPLRYRLLNLNAAHLIPVFLPNEGDAVADLLLGNRQGGLSKLSVRLGERHDASALVVGKTGSGKTFLFSWLAKYGCLNLGGHVVVADNKGPKNSSYRPMCELLGGHYVHLKHDDDVSFNPFPQLSEVRRADGELDKTRLEGLESILYMMTEDPRSALHPDYARNVVRRVVLAVYEGRSEGDGVPILSDAVAAARGLQFGGAALQDTARAVAERLQLWCEDPVRRRLFNTPKSLDTDNALTVFDFHGFTRDNFLAAVLISILSQRIEAKMNELPRNTPKLFAFDEAWAMFDGSAEATSLLNRLYRTARSYGACVYTLTQSHHDVTHSAAAQGILANVGLVYLMRHQDGHAEAADYFRLNGAQRALFRGLQMVPGEYAESLLIDALQGRTRVLRYCPTPFDLWCDTSRPDDVALRDQALGYSGQSLEATIVALARLCPRGASHDPRVRAEVLRTVAAAQTPRRAS